MRSDHLLAAIGNCPLCGQGRQIIAKEINTGVLFILCEDCEAQWKSPADSRSLGRVLSGIYGKSNLLTYDDLTAHPWATYLDKWM